MKSTVGLLDLKTLLLH